MKKEKKEIIIKNEIDKNYFETYVTNLKVIKLSDNMFRGVFYESTLTEEVYSVRDDTDGDMEDTAIENKSFAIIGNDKYDLNDLNRSFFTEIDKLGILVTKEGLENIKSLVDKVLDDIKDNEQKKEV